MLKVIDEQKEKKRHIGCWLLLLIPLLLIAAAIGAVYMRYGQEIFQAYKVLFPSSKQSTTTELTSFNVTGSIYYVKNRNLYKASGSTLTQITKTSDVDEAVVSQDGKYCVYTKVSPNYSELYLLDMTSNSTTLLTKNAGSKYMSNDIWNLDASISSDDKSILFISDKSKYSTGNYDLSVYSMDLGTKVMKQLTQGNPYTGGDQDPVYFPLDPNYFVYTKYIYDEGQPQPYSKLYVMNIKTKQSIAITPDESGTMQAAFSPDGKYVAFIQRESTDGNNDNNTNLYLMPFSIDNIAAHNATQAFAAAYNQKVLMNTGLDSMPVFSSTGDHIAFMTAVNQKFSLATVAITTQTQNDGSTTLAPKDFKVISQIDPVTATSRLAWTQ